MLSICLQDLARQGHGNGQRQGEEVGSAGMACLWGWDCTWAEIIYGVGSSSESGSSSGLGAAQGLGVPLRLGGALRLGAALGWEQLRGWEYLWGWEQLWCWPRSSTVLALSTGHTSILSFIKAPLQVQHRVCCTTEHTPPIPPVAIWIIQHLGKIKG